MQTPLQFIQRFHRERSGAILILMLAACLILMMTAWVIFDATKASSQNIKTQTAGDVAAMSQAAVKARSMNMLAYSNVAKRSVFAIHTTYLSSFLAYIDWAVIMNTVADALSRFDNTTINALSADLEGLAHEWINLWWREAGDDFEDYSGVDLLSQLGLRDGDHEIYKFKPSDIINFRDLFAEMFRSLFSGNLSGFFDRVLDDIRSKDALSFIRIKDDGATLMLKDDASRTIKASQWSGLSTQYYAQDIKALDNYQRYIVGITPWWGWMEQLVRGMRNGATATVSFPNPPGMTTFGTDLVNEIAATLGISQAQMPNSDLLDTLPVRPGDGKVFDTSGADQSQRRTMEREIREQLDNNIGEMVKQIFRLFFDNSNFDVGQDGRQAFAMEYMANLLIITFFSDYPTYSADSMAGKIIAKIMEYGGMQLLVGLRSNHRFKKALGVSQHVFREALGDYTVDPWVLLRYEHEGAWLSKISNLVFAYNARTELHGRDRQKFGIPSEDYQLGGGGVGGVGGGIFNTLYGTMYRAPGMWALSRAEMFYAGEDEPNMWSPTWSARMRPVVLPAELEAGGYPLDESFHDVATGLGLVVMVNPSFVPRDALMDFVQLERSLRAMGPSTYEGVSK